MINSVAVLTSSRIISSSTTSGTRGHFIFVVCRHTE
jgi:hypothetical protein